MELASLDLQGMLFWSKIGYLGIFFFPTLFLLFVFQYTGRNNWISLRNILLLFLIPILLLIAKFTDDVYHLVYSTTWLDTSGLIPMIGFTRGPIYPFALYSFLPGVLGVILLWQKRNHTPPLYQHQTTLIAVSAMLPLVVLIFYMTGLQPFPELKYLDFNVFVYTLSGMGVGWAMYRYRLFDLAPIAREALIERLSDGVFVLDAKARLVDANPAALRLLGLTQPPIGQNATQVFSTWKDLLNICNLEVQVKPLKAEIHHEMNGKSAFFDTSVSNLSDGYGINFGRLIVVHEITERKLLEEKLRELSLLDELTGLNNRRGFNVLGTQFLYMVKRMSLKAVLIFGDMDGMKKINDTFGHGEGDQALLEFANLLLSSSRSSDILARMGGDEFIVLAVETTEKVSDGLLARMNSNLEIFNSQPDRKYPISVSFGVAHYDPEQPIGLEELINQADNSMYEEKQRKKQARTGEKD